MQDHILVNLIWHKSVLAMLGLCLPCGASVLSAPAAPKDVPLCSFLTRSAILTVIVRLVLHIAPLFSKFVLLDCWKTKIRNSLYVCYVLRSTKGIMVDQSCVSCGQEIRNWARIKQFQGDCHTTSIICFVSVMVWMTVLCGKSPWVFFCLLGPENETHANWHQSNAVPVLNSEWDQLCLAWCDDIWARE